MLLSFGECNALLQLSSNFFFLTIELTIILASFLLHICVSLMTSTHLQDSSKNLEFLVDP